MAFDTGLMQTKNVGNVIRAQRLRRKLTLEQLAEAPGVGLDAANLSRFERGQQSIALPRLEAIAAALETPLSEIYAEVEGLRPIPDANTEEGPGIRGRLPLVSWVQAGSFQNIEDPFLPGDADVWVPVTRRYSKRAFALRIRGDSMVDPSGIGPSFPEGSIICVEPDATPIHKSFVVVRLDNSVDATFKQLIIDGDARYLKPLNPRYPIMTVTDEATICGVVMQMIMDF